MADTSNPLIRPYGAATIAAAAALIRDGKLVAVPTETVYGLAADSTNNHAVAAIYATKDRPAFNPLIIHVADRAMAAGLADFDAVSARLVDQFWPGPLTLVVPRRADAGIASLASAGLDSIALRCPAHPAMRDLIVAAGVPIAAPSANPSGRISPTRADHVAAGLGDKVAMIVDAGPTAAGLESTIVTVADDAIILLRPGPITPEQLTAATGLSVRARGAGVAVNAPGQLASHYAPTQKVTLHATTRAADAFHIGFGPGDCDANLSATGDLDEAAANLFDLLHRAQNSGRAHITVAPIPGHGIGVAINDRLARAAAPRPD